MGIGLVNFSEKSLDNKMRLHYISNAGPNPSIAAGLFGAASSCFETPSSREGVSVLWTHLSFQFLSKKILDKIMLFVYI
jgi:hypothetical protein